MQRFLKYGLLLLLVFAEARAGAMPIGVKIALNGRAAAQEAVNAVFPVLDGEVSAVDIAKALAEAEDESDTFSSDNIDITFDTPVNGKAKFTVSPPSDAGDSFFMRVKVK